MLVHSKALFPILLDEMFNSVNNHCARMGKTPPKNVLETEKDYVIEVCVPGLCRNDLLLTLTSDSQLVIDMQDRHVEAPAQESAESCPTGQCTQSDKRYLRRDFTPVRFKETITLPDNIHRDRITAKVEHGILRIVLPKVTAEEQALKVQTIQID